MLFPENDLVVNTARAAGKNFDYNDALYAMTGDFSSVSDINDRMRAWEQAVPGLSTKYIPYTYSPLYAALTSSAILNRGTGNPTFIRATTAYVTDFEGLAKNCKSGETRFTGARRVENIIGTKSEDASVNISLQANSTQITTNVALNTVNASYWYKGAGTAQDVGAIICGKILLSAGTKSNVCIRLSGNTNGTGSTIANVTLTSTPTWYSLITSSGSVVVQSFSVGLDNRASIGASDTGTGNVNVWNCQIENVTGQSNQNPSEYVSVGVLSSPFHGAMVDGVKYFPYQNGNTVASNVVTEAQGATIANTMLKGYLAEPLAQNLCLQSEIFQTTWAVTANSSISTDTAVSPNGSTTADSLNEDSTANLAHPVTQVISKAASAIQYTFSVYIKKAGRSIVCFTLWDNVSVGSRYWFDVNNGTVLSTSNIGAGFTSLAASIELASNGFYRCKFTATSNTGTSLSLNIHSCDTDGVITTTTGLGAVGLYLWGAQVELGSVATSYIPTTTVAVTRNMDVLIYSSSGNAVVAQGSMYGEITCPANLPATNILQINDGTTQNRLGFYNSDSTHLNGLIVSGNVIQSDITLAGTLTNTNKVAMSWNTNYSNFSMNGTLGVADTTVTVPVSFTTISVGSAAGGGNIGNIKNVRIWLTQLSDAILKGLTT